MPRQISHNWFKSLSQFSNEVGKLGRYARVARIDLHTYNKWWIITLCCRQQLQQGLQQGLQQLSAGLQQIPPGDQRLQQQFIPDPQQQFIPQQQQFSPQQPPPFLPQGGSFSSASSSASSGPIGGINAIVAFPVPVFITRRPRCVTSTGERGRCKPLSQCVTFYAEVPELRKQPCPLNEVETGVCCPKKKRQQREFYAYLLIHIMYLLETNKEHAVWTYWRRYWA